MLAEWLHALHEWEVAALIRRSVYLYPLLNAGHIFALTLLIGTIVPADLKMLGLFRGLPAGAFLRLMSGFSATGLALAVRLSAAWGTAQAGGDISPGLRIAALLSMGIWISALLAGRWIAFL